MADSPAGAPHPSLLPVARGQLAPRAVDAEQLVSSALEHRMGGLLVSQAARGDLSWLPQQQLHRLAVADLEIQMKHRRLWDVLGVVRERLEPLDIDPLVIKGVAWEALLYERLGERPTGDLDLVILAQDHRHLGAVLDALRLPPEVVTKTVGLVERRVLQHLDVVLDGVHIDLHFDPLKLGIWSRSHDVFERSSQVLQTQEGSCRTLSNEAILLSLVTHANKDRFAYLSAFADVARLLGQPGAIDGATFHALVEGDGLQVPVDRSLRAMSILMNTDTAVVETQEQTGGWRGWLWDRLWAEKGRLGGRRSRHQHRKRQLAIPMLTVGRHRDVIAEARRQLLPPRALLEIQGGGLGHSYLRRVTLDRFRATRGRAATDRETPAA